MSHDHFNELKNWSKRKHELLINYLKPFVRILGGSKNISVYYIDGFAGPGKYDDGCDGSPLLAAEYAKEIKDKNYGLKCINVEIDGESFENLEQNTRQYEDFVTNFHGSFSENLPQILEIIGNDPAFFFLDPFGLKGIEWENLYPLLTRKAPTELLFRIKEEDVCRLAGFCDSVSQGSELKREVITKLLGVDSYEDWKPIWESEGITGLLNFYFKKIANEIGHTRGRGYVGKYEVKSIDGKTKYLLIYATGHDKGVILMNDTIYHRNLNYEEEVREYEQRKLCESGQMGLFPDYAFLPSKEEIFSEKVAQIKDFIKQRFSGKSVTRTEINLELIKIFFGRYSQKHLTTALKELENENVIKEIIGIVSADKTKFIFS